MPGARLVLVLTISGTTSGLTGTGAGTGGARKGSAEL